VDLAFTGSPQRSLNGTTPRSGWRKSQLTVAQIWSPLGSIPPPFSSTDREPMFRIVIRNSIFSATGTIIVRNVPSKLVQSLNALARRHKRSMVKVAKAFPDIARRPRALVGR
jgi:hypothetical protein